ncbi:hypothetical protein EVAR_21882_1 [Eumeta japonica]|uniref:Uncharacterized protein n=1 Tax=Eumeta variegata TaxID=151549 RepID=A0A4C1V8I9_EUMVA|nr:hypothetical protein EVAR_21882_1 [Eumeta japonica]
MSNYFRGAKIKALEAEASGAAPAAVRHEPSPPRSARNNNFWRRLRPGTVSGYVSSKGTAKITAHTQTAAAHAHARAVRAPRRYLLSKHPAALRLQRSERGSRYTL